jgi:hypothetical protein
LEERFVWVPYLIHPSINRAVDAVRGRTTKLVSCEACGRNYAYELKRTGYGHDDPSFWSFWGSYTAAKQRAEADLRGRLATGIEVIPCPACGWYQSSMIPEARERHRLWMHYVGACLTVGLVVPAMVGICILPFPVFVAGLVSLLAVGTGLLVWRSRLARCYDPNGQDVEARKRYGQSRATLLSDQEARDVLAHAGAYNLSVEPPGRLKRCIVRIILAAVVLGLAGLLAGRWIIRSTVAARFEKDVQSYAALAPESPPQGVPQPRPPQPGGVTGRVKGKMVVVNVHEGKIDDLHFSLPDDLRAANPEGVGTVVLLTWGKIKISGEGPISSMRGVEYQQFCQLKVFDWESKSEVASRVFLGGFPESNLLRLGPVTGPKPDAAQMLSFLAGLPRQ